MAVLSMSNALPEGMSFDENLKIMAHAVFVV